MKKACIIFSFLSCFLPGFSPGLFAQAFDFGDIPDPPYPTLLVNNGPRHQFSPLFLGNFWDAETDGTLGMMAFGDDMNNSWSDDEDGIQFQSFLLPGQTCTIEVTASMPGLLNGWIDFDFNLQWTDPYDQIFTDQPLNQGLNILTFQVPSNVMQGKLTFARFRISSSTGLGFTGPAIDGEVEDYNVLLGAPVSQEIFLDPDPSLSYTQNEISLVRLSGTGTPYDGWLAAAYNESPWRSGPGMGVSVSSDNGATWTASHLPYPTNTITMTPMAESFDPTIAADDSGHLFVAQIATDGNWFASPSSGLFVYKSTDGGTSWGSPVTVDIKPGTSVIDSNYRLNDRCQIRADGYDSSPFHNSIYLAWIQDRGNDPSKLYGDIYFSRSTDGGRTFSPAQVVNSWDHNMGNMPIHDVASDGTIYLLWVDYNVQTGGTGILYIDKSTDGGTTWGPDNQVIIINVPPLNLNNYTDARAKGAAILRVSPLNPQVLYVVFAADMNTADQDEADIYFISSQDAGSTWSIPLRVNDDLNAAAVCDQVLPWMEVQPDGTIHIAWYDRRNDPMDLYWDVYYTNSTDGGQTFSANQKINLQPFYTPLVWIPYYAYWDSWMGEYLGLAIGDYTAYVAYTSRVQDQSGDVLLGKYVFSSAGREERSGSGSGEDLFILYPNPTSGDLNVVMKSKETPRDLQAEILSVYGQCLYRTTILNRSTFSLPAGQLTSGIYWVRISTSGQTGNQKFIKVN